MPNKWKKKAKKLRYNYKPKDTYLVYRTEPLTNKQLYKLLCSLPEEYLKNTRIIPVE